MKLSFSVNSLNSQVHTQSSISCCCCCSVIKSCPTLCSPLDCSTPGFPAFHYLSEFAQTHVHLVGDAISFWVEQKFASVPTSVFVWISIAYEMGVIISWYNVKWECSVKIYSMKAPWKEWQIEISVLFSSEKHASLHCYTGSTLLLDETVCDEGPQGWFP